MEEQDSITPTEDVYWNDSVASGKEYSQTTWFRISPELRDFYKLVKSKEKIAAVILEEDSLNIGFILAD